jgi:RHS repeat-associated protein
LHYLTSIFLTLLFFLTGENFAVAKNQAPSASIGFLCTSASQKEFLTTDRTDSTDKSELDCQVAKNAKVFKTSLEPVFRDSTSVHSFLTSAFLGDLCALAVNSSSSRTTTGPISQIIPSQSQTFTVNDRLTTDTYNANGNTTSSLITDHGSLGTNASDIYSFDNKLIRRTTPDGKTIDLTYSPDGHRLSKFITQNGLTQRLVHYLTDANNPTGYAQVIEEKQPLDTTSPLKKVNLYGHDLISTESRSVGVSPTSSIFYNYDGLGSVRSISKESGDLQETYDYDAYGTLIGLAKRNLTTGLLESSLLTDHSALITQSEFLYTGEQWDADLGMYFLRARYLNTNTGRFHSQDTYEGDKGSPLTLHKYLYANGNPAMFTDPSGYFGLPDSAAVIGGLQTLARFTLLGASTGGVFGAIVGSRTQLGVLRGAWVGALGGAALQIGYMTGRLNEVVWNGILNAIGSSVTYLAQQSFGDSINWSGLINPIASGFAYGALSSATIGLLGFDSWKTQAGVAALVAAITSGVSDIIDAASGNSRFNLGATILRAVGNATIAAITQPAAAASLLSGARGADASPVTIELFERAASDSRSFQLLQALIAGSYATVPSTFADNL